MQPVPHPYHCYAPMPGAPSAPWGASPSAGPGAGGATYVHHVMVAQPPPPGMPYPHPQYMPSAPMGAGATPPPGMTVHPVPYPQHPYSYPGYAWPAGTAASAVPITGYAPHIHQHHHHMGLALPPPQQHSPDMPLAAGTSSGTSGPESNVDRSQPCRHFLRGCCSRTRCRFSHHVPEGTMLEEHRPRRQRQRTADAQLWEPKDVRQRSPSSSEASA